MRESWAVVESDIEISEAEIEDEILGSVEGLESPGTDAADMETEILASAQELVTAEVCRYPFFKRLSDYPFQESRANQIADSPLPAERESQTTLLEMEEDPVTPRQEIHGLPDERVPLSTATPPAVIPPPNPSSPPPPNLASRQPSPTPWTQNGTGDGLPGDDSSYTSETGGNNTRFTSRDKGKGRMRIIYSDDEGEHGPGGDPERSPTPRPQEQRQVSSTVPGFPSCHNFFSSTTQPETTSNVSANLFMTSLAIYFNS